MSRLVMVRHAQASLGEPDYDRLSEVGEEQARRLGVHWADERAVFDRVFIGPRQRHQRTAAIVGNILTKRGLAWPEPLTVAEADEYAGLEVFRLGLPLLAGRDPVVREQAERWQRAPSGPSPELLRLFQSVLEVWVKGELDVPGVETWREFRARAQRGLDQILEAGAGGKSILVVTSTGPVAVALDRAVGLDDARLLEASWQLRNTSVSEFLFSPPRFTMSVFNALPHLNDPGLVTRI
jgi:broad specificity phosphatase PhoE